MLNLNKLELYYTKRDKYLDKDKKYIYFKVKILFLF